MSLHIVTGTVTAVVTAAVTGIRTGTVVVNKSVFVSFNNICMRRLLPFLTMAKTGVYHFRRMNESIVTIRHVTICSEIYICTL